MMAVWQPRRAVPSSDMALFGTVWLSRKQVNWRLSSLLGLPQLALLTSVSRSLEVGKAPVGCKSGRYSALRGATPRTLI